MISYVYRNGMKSTNNIKTKINSLFNVEIIENSKENLIMGNNNLLFLIEDKFTSILLYDDTINLRSLANYFMEDTNE